MLLTEYQGSANPRGIHAPADVRFIDPRYASYLGNTLKFGWYKIVALGQEHGATATHLMNNGVTPIVRIYRPTPGAMPVDAQLLSDWVEYRRIGVRWFEFYNEPNLAVEWPAGTWVHHQNFAGIIQPLCENWLIFAENIINLGGYPGFPALSEAIEDAPNTIAWMDALLRYLADRHFQRFINIANNGMYIATHPYVLNHYYQEIPGGGPASARPPEQQNGMEGGWHFEYPYDPISQRLDPGRSVFGGTPQTPGGDPNGLTAMGVAFHARLAEWFGLGTLPVVGTEGGIYSPTLWNNQPDTRYPPITPNSHAEATAAMFNWIATSAPPWLFTVTLWKLDELLDGALPLPGRLEQIPVTLRQTPPLSSQGAGIPVAYSLPPRGPGPIHGEPDFHMVILPPDLDAAWFYQTAGDYWNRFRPIVGSITDFIGFFTQQNSLAVTLIAPRDGAEDLVRAITDPYPNVFMDLLLTEGTYENLAVVLADRARRGARFG